MTIGTKEKTFLQAKWRGDTNTIGYDVSQLVVKILIETSFLTQIETVCSDGIISRAGLSFPTPS